jgi:hypothetical protein
MPLQFQGCFSQQPGLGEGARLLANWDSAFPRLIPQAFCESRVSESAAIKDFYAHFRPVRPLGPRKLHRHPLSVKRRAVPSHLCTVIVYNLPSYLLRSEV